MTSGARRNNVTSYGVAVIGGVQVAIAMAIVGSSVVAGKVVAEVLPVFLASALRFAIASAILVPLLLIKEKCISIPNKRDAAFLILGGFFGTFLFSVFMLYGLRITSATDAGILTGTLPAVIAVLAILLLGESIDLGKGIGIILSMAGVLVINISEAPASGAGETALLGAALILLAIVCEGLFAVLGKAVSGRYSPLYIATFMSVIGLVLSLIAVGTGLESHPTDLRTVTADVWFAVAYFGLVVTVIAFHLFYAGLAKIDAGVAGIFTAIMPLSAVGLSFAVLGETIQKEQVIGGVLVLAAVVVIWLRDFIKKENECSV